MIINARFLTQKITGVQQYAIEILKQLKQLTRDIRFVAPWNIIHKELAEELEVERFGLMTVHLWEKVHLLRYIRHCVTIGCKMLPDGSQGPSPVLSDRVEIGANSVILGGIKIGDDPRIAAGSVVIHDVSPRIIVGGNPPRELRKSANYNPENKSRR